MTAEVTAWLAPRADGLYLDCTVGLGGHAAALLDAGAGRVIGLDRDPAALAHAAARLQAFGARAELVHADYRSVADVLGARGIAGVDGALADLGVSSMQLDDAARGFSFRHDGPLDMRMDPTSGTTLADRLADVDEATLAAVLTEFGEERHARRIARAIVTAQAHRPLTGTAELASVVRRASGGGKWRRIDPATRTFQALRIWVNDELGGLRVLLEAVLHVLHRGGRLVLIAFHSLEDRIVKHTFRHLEQTGQGRVLTRKPQAPGLDEQERNPRARSAKLRVMEKVA
jgi:16S rRNA (cytosine1402-N4)-methyltransferase